MQVQDGTGDFVWFSAAQKADSQPRGGLLKPAWLGAGIGAGDDGERERVSRDCTTGRLLSHTVVCTA